MITRLFRNRKRLDSDRPEDRLAAIAALTDDEAATAQQTLTDMAGNDPDSAVRQQALGRLTDHDALQKLLTDPQLVGPVARHIADLLESGLPQHAAIEVLSSHPAVIRARLAGQPSAALIATILATDDESLLLDAILLSSREHKDKLIEHPAFHQASLLQELEHRSRDRDKRTNRFARSRLESLKQSRAVAERLAAQIRERLDSLEKPVTAATDKETRRHQILLDAVTADMTELAEAGATLARAGESLPELATLQSRLSALRVAQTSIQATEQAARAAAPREKAADAERTDAPVIADTDFEPLTLAFEQLDEGLGKRSDFDALAAERQALTARWLAQADRALPTEAQHTVFERVSQRFQQLASAHKRLARIPLSAPDTSMIPEHLDVKTPPDPALWQAIETLARNLASTAAAIDKLSWPDWAPTPINELRQSLDATSKRLTEWQAQVDEVAARATAGLATLDSHIEAGELRKARQQAATVRNLLRAIPARLAQPLDRHLGRSSARLAELSDWQTFATTPKREALCTAMTALADDPLTPQDQAQRIKQLRTEWNGLGPVTGSADHKLMDIFNAAAERAFEPCRAYFAEQAELRNRNLEARKAICESLSGYLESTDWSQTDYKAAEQIMRAAREEWRTYHPVDRTPGKPVEERFEALQAALHERIKSEWDSNLARKQAIVQQAQALMESDQDVGERIEAAKVLQQQWQAIGVTPRRPDQVLWRDFRKACDAIFEARDAARKSADESIRAQQLESAAVLEAFKADLDDESLDFGPAELRDHQARFEALSQLPERLQRPLEKEFNELVRAAQLILSNARAAAELARRANLKDLDAAVSALEQQQLAGENVSFEAPDPLFAHRWSQIDQPVPLDELRRLVIEAEIAAETESTETDRELRLAIQVELMNTGRGRQALQADPDELTASWCRSGPKDARIDPLRDRFFQAIDKLSAR